MRKIKAGMKRRTRGKTLKRGAPVKTRRARAASLRRAIQNAEAPKDRATPCACYIVQCADGTLYTGWAVDAEKRLKMHNAGRGARYTSTRRPVKLVYVEPQPDRISAMKRELAIKRLTREKKLALIGAAHGLLQHPESQHNK